ncbi:unnamed protein product (mitochondrion) [Plasmodiophora brassicae]|uniref:Mitochondrial thiamine pyrophosphate carrier 1 n=1 Tax=Plasmodiophora brassicae TaxID=37360 RepID=A0A3P3YKA4_PLABS|nr:unnamed protein product [Plasmodiophora brassicae]
MYCLPWTRVPPLSSSGATAFAGACLMAAHGDELDALISGAIAGGVARCVIAPLDLVKIRLQIQDGAGPRLYTGILQTMREVTRSEGVAALWKGNTSALLMVVPYAAIQFATYNVAHEYLADLSPAFASLGAGSAAGITATIATYPLDLFRTRMAAQHRSGVKLRATLMGAWNSGGVSGLYRGLWPTLVGIAPYAALQFFIYEQLNVHGATILKRLKCEDFASGWHFCSGFLAGVGSKTLTMPFDVVKKRFQVREYEWRRGDSLGSSNPKPTGVFRCAVDIVRTEGVLALYKGTAASIAKAAPNSAVTFFVFETCRNAIRYCRQRFSSDALR